MTNFASIVVSAWNRPDLLKRSLESLWQNTTYPYELIVHDDGSQPETSNWLHSLVLQNKISTLISNPPGWNRGHGTSVNRAIDISEGDPIIKLNGDEVFAKNWLETTVKAMQLFPEVKIMHLAWYFLRPNPSLPIEQVEWSWQDPPVVMRSFERENIKIRVVWCGPGCGFAISRQTWNENGKWYAIKSPGFVEDMDYRLRVCPMMRLLKKNPRIAHLDPPDNMEDHWERYRFTPWLGVLDPPVVSYHPGFGKCSIGDAQKTLKDGPFILGVK